MSLSDHATALFSPQALLWRALVPLRSVVSFMNTGAHPDDETSALLAALGWRDGLDLSYACATRGEGGQNDIGVEATEALGVLRTAEMERAADALNLRLYWLSTHPSDSIFDFGFSKSGVETMGKWGRDRTLRRFVEILRQERPDIICPTFLNVPGQHGHHRAMTEAAHVVMGLAADHAFDTGQAPWQVKKLYLPAWSGAGQAYDDDLPPPDATLIVQADGRDPVTGLSYENIGQYARWFHKTQAMGRWVPEGSERNWPLHLVQSHVAGPDDSLCAGLPRTLADLGHPLAQAEIDAAFAAFPASDAILTHAVRALQLLEGETHENSHKILRKRTQLAHLIRVAAGVKVAAFPQQPVLDCTQSTSVKISQRNGVAEAVVVTPLLPEGWQYDTELRFSPDAQPTDPYPSVHLPDTPRAPALKISVTVQGHTSHSIVPFETPPVLLPTPRATLTPSAHVINSARGQRVVPIGLTQRVPNDSMATLALPTGIISHQTPNGFELTMAADIPTGHYTLPLTLKGAPGFTVRPVTYSHIAPRALAAPAALRLLVVDVALPPVRIGYIGGGHDRLDHWLGALGFDVTSLSDDDLICDTALGRFDTLVIGIFAVRFRAGLAKQMPRLHRWTKAGGTLLTLYHRPWDNWTAETTPPLRLEIGQPSLRWRVTDETAQVTHLHPHHPLLTTPNQITAADWEGWHKERGLYFAKSWDTAYTPLLEMADPDEPPHRGALLVADIERGRHVHCALILHHQMEKLVSGAFRLIANLVSKRD